MSNSRDFLPSKDAALLLWGQTFQAGIASAPTTLGLTTAQVDRFGELYGSFEALMALVSSGETKTPSKIIGKNEARKNLKAEARLLARIINAFPATTNQTRSDLGLTVRKERGNTPIIDFAPSIDIVSTRGHAMELQFHTGMKRGKPEGVAGVTCFYMAGEEASDNPEDWTFGFATTKTTGTLDFPLNLAPGTKVFVTAFWRNALDESSPAAEAVSSFIGFTASTAAKATSLRKAA